MARIRIGTSGWHYDSWRSTFFPQKLLIKHQLRYYASQFTTTELNGVFYRTPTAAAVKHWRQETSGDFIFSWKASKFITHWKRLSDNSRNSLKLMESRLRVLEPKVGPVLFQLPPQMAADLPRLQSFIRLLEGYERRYVFEFRHPSWYTKDILSTLSNSNMALCISDHEDAPAPWERTTDFVYIRGHGPTGRYAGRYRKNQLADWASAIKRWSRRYDTYVYFDNDQKGAAPMDALQLQAMLRKAG